MSEMKKKKDSNELLNILMNIIGGLFILMGIINLLAWVGISVGFDLTNPAIQAVLSVFGPSGLVSVILGFWALVAGMVCFANKNMPCEWV